MSFRYHLTSSRQNASRGFSLIELMMAVAIIGVLVAIAMPQYGDYVRKSQVAEATTTLLEYRTRMEQFYQDSRNYGAVPACGILANQFVNRKYFTITCVSNNAGQGYLITATGNSGSVVGSDYTINEANTRTTTNFKSAAQVGKNCWLISGGEC